MDEEWVTSSKSVENSIGTLMFNLELVFNCHITKLETKIDALIDAQNAMMSPSHTPRASAMQNAHSESENTDVSGLSSRWEPQMSPVLEENDETIEKLAPTASVDVDALRSASTAPQPLRSAPTLLLSSPSTECIKRECGTRFAPTISKTKKVKRAIQPVVSLTSPRRDASTASVMSGRSKMSQATSLPIVHLLTGMSSKFDAAHSSHTAMAQDLENGHVRFDVKTISSNGRKSIRERFRSKNQRHRYTVCRHIYELMEQPESSFCARWLAHGMLALNILGVLVAIFGTINPAPINAIYAAVLENTLGVLFTLELLLRFVVCPSYVGFFSSFLNWIDMVAFCLSIFRGLILPRCEALEFLASPMVSIMPVLRLLKMLRRFPKFNLLTNAFVLAGEAMPVLIFTLSLIILSFSAVLYLVEPDDNIGSLTEAGWFVLVTMMTIGYGDVIPKTVVGEFVTGALIICGALYMSMPLGIVGGSFSTVWEDRDRIMLMQCTRERLYQWGYTPKDIPELFFAYDSDKSGELSLREFCQMISEMQLGIDEDRIVNLFSLFDADDSGAITDTEFVRTLFPKAFIKIYGSDGDESVAVEPLREI